jgi:DNA repair protein RadC
MLEINNLRTSMSICNGYMPSGVAEPSPADRAITRELRDALQLVGVRVLDHLVIGSGAPVSMAALGLL